MSQQAIRVFLLTDSSELEPLCAELGDFLREQTTPSFDPILLAEAHPSAELTVLDMREGDLLFALLDGLHPLATEDALDCCRKAALQQMLVVPALCAENPRNSALRALEREFITTTIDVSGKTDIVLANIYACLSELISLISPQTDLLLDWIRETPSNLRISKNQSALALLNEEGNDSRSSNQLAQSARESRQRAVRAIQSRLFEPAMAALTEASEFDATSGITCHWRARLLAAKNRREDIHAAVREATRSARLAHMHQPGCFLEIAGWRLAAQIAARLGDTEAVYEYLQEAHQFESDTTRMRLGDARILHQIGALKEAVSLLEAAYIREPEALDQALQDPALAGLHTPLRQMHGKREHAIRDSLNRLFKCEDYLLSHTPLTDTEHHRKAQLASIQRCQDRADLNLLQIELRATAARLINHLSLWAEDLCAQHIEISNLRRQQAVLAEISLEPPERGPWDDLLEQVWPEAKRRRTDLDRARRETIALKESTNEQLLKKTAVFFGALEAFLRTVGKCEAAIANSPHLFTLNPRAEEPKASELAFLTADDFARLGLKQDPALLPDALLEYIGESLDVPAARIPGVYRLEFTSGMDLGASRCGVFFHSMRNGAT